MSHPQYTFPGAHGSTSAAAASVGAADAEGAIAEARRVTMREIDFMLA